MNSERLTELERSNKILKDTITDLRRSQTQSIKSLKDHVIGDLKSRLVGKEEEIACLKDRMASLEANNALQAANIDKLLKANETKQRLDRGEFRDSDFPLTHKFTEEEKAIGIALSQIQTDMVRINTRINNLEAKCNENTVTIGRHNLERLRFENNFNASKFDERIQGLHAELNTDVRAINHQLAALKSEDTPLVSRLFTRIKNLEGKIDNKFAAETIRQNKFDKILDALIDLQNANDVLEPKFLSNVLKGDGFVYDEKYRYVSIAKFLGITITEARYLFCITLRGHECYCRLARFLKENKC